VWAYTVYSSVHYRYILYYEVITLCSYLGYPYKDVINLSLKLRTQKKVHTLSTVDCTKETLQTYTADMIYAFFWVIPRRLNFIFQRFGTHYIFDLSRL
jgi:hypothetical protein